MIKPQGTIKLSWSRKAFSMPQSNNVLLFFLGFILLFSFSAHAQTPENSTEPLSPATEFNPPPLTEEAKKIIQQIDATDYSCKGGDPNCAPVVKSASSCETCENCMRLGMCGPTSREDIHLEVGTGEKGTKIKATSSKASDKSP